MSLLAASETTTPGKINWSEQPQMRRLDAHETSMRSLQFFEDGTQASLSSDNEVKIWNKEGVPTIIHTFQAVVSQLVTRKDGTLATATKDGEAVHVWDKKEKCLAFYVGKPGNYTRKYPPKDEPFPTEDGFPNFTFCHRDYLKLRDGGLAHGDNEGRIILYSAQGDLLPCLLPYNSGTKVVVVQQKDGQLVSAGEDGVIKEWDVEGGSQYFYENYIPPFFVAHHLYHYNDPDLCTRTFKAHQAAIRTLAVLDNEAAVASGSDDKTIKIWREGVCLRTLEGHTSGIRNLSVLSDGTLLSLSALEPNSEHNQMKLWERAAACINTVMMKGEMIEEVFERGEGTLVGRILFRENGVEGSSSGKIKFWTFPLKA